VPAQVPGAAAEEVPPTVQVSPPVAREVADSEDFTGRTVAVDTVDLRAHVTGYLVKTPFEEGSQVKKGDLLFEIDPRPYQARLGEAQAQVEVGKARLKAAEAKLARQQALPAAVKQEVDEAKAAVEEAKAQLKASEAAVLVYKLDLEYCHVTAPIDGTVGRYAVTAGNLVQQDQTQLTTIVSKDPMYAYFDVDEETYLNVRQAIRDGKIKADKMTELPVAVGLANEKGFPHKGKVNFVDNHLDPQTGTIRVRVTLPNGDGRLVPGLFVRVRLTTSEPYKALLVPERAFAKMSGDDEAKFVFVVNDKDVVERRKVVGSRQDGSLMVKEGLKPDDRVIVSDVRVPIDREGKVVKPVKAPEPAPPKAQPDKP
jgi:multidrug efflux system membrane fusion protein